MKPILFNTDMVRALLEGRKTVTRLKPFQMADGYVKVKGMYRDDKNHLCAVFRRLSDYDVESVHAPYRPGDILYVRETWNKDPFSDGFIYPTEYPGAGHKWRPSIHMPREAARIFLRVTDVRVEQLCAITGKQARAEGFLTRDAFIRAFLTMYPDCAMKSWVWVIEFERISREEAMRRDA